MDVLGSNLSKTFLASREGYVGGMRDGKVYKGLWWGHLIENGNL